MNEELKPCVAGGGEQIPEHAVPDLGPARPAADTSAAERV